MNKFFLLVLVLYGLLVPFISLSKDYHYFSHKKKISWAARESGKTSYNRRCYYTNDNEKCDPDKWYWKYLKFDSIELLGYHSNLENTFTPIGDGVYSVLYIIELNNCINPYLVELSKEECQQDEDCIWYYDDNFIGRAHLITKKDPVCKPMKAFEIMSGITSVGYK